MRNTEEIWALVDAKRGGYICDISIAGRLATGAGNKHEEFAVTACTADVEGYIVAVLHGCIGRIGCYRWNVERMELSVAL